MTQPRRVIAHLDIDAFYASVELRRHPELRGRPVIVAGSGPRAVVTTASYEARRFGVDSAMPAARARALCPAAVVLAPDFEAYRRVSSEVWGLVRERVAVIQHAGIDEAYLDLSEEPLPIALLRGLVELVRERTAMTLSVGVGPSRLVAKTASASFKPAAFVAMSREQAVAHFAGHPVRVLQGVGPKTAERLAALGLRTVGALQNAPSELLAARFGERMAAELRARAHFDESPVEPVRVAKSRSSEVTFPADVSDRAKLEQALVGMAGELGEGLRARGRRGAHDRDQGAARGLDHGDPRADDRRLHRLRRNDRGDRRRAAAGVRSATPGAPARGAGRLVRGRSQSAGPRRPGSAGVPALAVRGAAPRAVRRSPRSATRRLRRAPAWWRR